MQTSVCLQDPSIYTTLNLPKRSAHSNPLATPSLPVKKFVYDPPPMAYGIQNRQSHSLSVALPFHWLRRRHGHQLEPHLYYITQVWLLWSIRAMGFVPSHWPAVAMVTAGSLPSSVTDCGADKQAGSQAARHTGTSRQYTVVLLSLIFPCVLVCSFSLYSALTFVWQPSEGHLGIYGTNSVPYWFNTERNIL